MPPRVLANTARVEMIYTENQQERANVFHVEVAGTGDPDLELIADTFDDHDDTFGKGLRTNQTALQSIIVTNISTSTQPQFTKAITPARVGTGGTGYTPGNVTSTVSWRSQFVGRQYRGRTYMVDTPSDTYTSGESINGGRAAALATWGAALSNLLDSIAHKLVIASFTHNAAHPVVSVIIETILDSMRRRLPGRGR